jgi:hypothetical protein
MRSYEKSSYADKDYGFDWEKWLDGDTLNTVEWIITPSGLAAANASNTTTVATVFLSGGEVGEEYIVRCRIATNNATPRKDSRYFTVSVVD